MYRAGRLTFCWTFLSRVLLRSRCLRHLWTLNLEAWPSMAFEELQTDYAWDPYLDSAATVFGTLRTSRNLVSSFLEISLCFSLETSEPISLPNLPNLFGTDSSCRLQEPQRWCPTLVFGTILRHQCCLYKHPQSLYTQVHDHEDSFFPYTFGPHKVDRIFLWPCWRWCPQRCW